MTLPRLLDAEGRFRLARERCTDRTQLGGAAHRSVHEETMNDSVDARGQHGVFGQEFVRYISTKAISPAGLIEPQQVLTIAAGLDRPHLANDAAFGKGIAHRTLRALAQHTALIRYATFTSRLRYDIQRYNRVENVDRA